MATLDQIYRAYLNEDPNVSQMKYDPFSWNAEQTFDDTTDEDTIDTSPATGGITNAYTGGGGGGAGYVPKYLPRDAEGFQIQPSGTGSGIFASQYRPDNYGVDRNIATFGAAGKPIMSGYTEEEEDPNLLQRFGTGIRDFVGGITSAISAPNILSRLGRPADAIYSYSGDVTGYGSRAGLTPEEVRNMKLLEPMGGVDDQGKDPFGINVVSAFGNYTAYNENRVAELEESKAKSQANWNSKYGSLENKNNLGKNWGEMWQHNTKELDFRYDVQEGIEEDEEEKMERIQKINEMKKLGYTEPSIVSPITALKTSPIQAAKDAAAEQAAFERDVIAADVRRDFQQAEAAPTTSAYTGGLKSPGHPANQGGGGFGKGDDPGGGTRGSPFQKGGRVRYGNGGIVDLL